MPKNKKPNINLNIYNNILDNSRNIFKNPFLSPLQLSSNKKNRLFTSLIKDISDNEQINIKRNNLLFSMNFNSILDELKKNRDSNNKKLKDDSFDKITDSLDKTINDEKTKLNSLEIVPFKKDKIFRSDFNRILNNIDKKFNLLYNNDLSNNIIKSDLLINKKDITTQFPPPPPDNLFGNNQVFNPFYSRSNINTSNAWNNPRPWSNRPMNSFNFGTSGNKPGIGFTNASKINKPAIIGKKIPIPPPISIKKTKVNIEREINGLDDILQLIKDYPIKVDVEYNINMQAMHNIKKPLDELNNMIGMNKLKDSIVDQIIFFSQNLHLDNDFMHTVIYGPPGTGKTEIAKIMGKIFSSIGVLTNNKFRKATRADLIAGYLGQTAIKTRDVIKDCLGGVLFIDEAYALGNPEKRDSFAKECIDTLCEGLSDNKDKLMVIIAGYEEDLDKCFFAYNQGLNSRFPWRFHTDDYKADELNKIFTKKVKDIGWSLKKDIKDSWFEEKMDYFKFFGRDMETLLAKTKIAHGRRVFCKKEDEKRVITKKDLDRGFEMFTDNKEVKSRQKTIKFDVSSMYL